MTKDEELYNDIKKAVEQAVDKVGIDGVRQMSMFPSSDWAKKNLRTPRQKSKTNK